MQEILNLLRVASESRQAELSEADQEKIQRIYQWQLATLEHAKNTSVEDFQPAVKSLYNYLTCTAQSDSTARRFATSMITEIPKQYRAFNSLTDWFKCIDYVIQRAPVFGEETFPMSKLFVFYMFSPSGNSLFMLQEFNSLLTQVLRTWCTFLDSSDSKSVLNPSQAIPATEGWLSPAAQEELCLEQSLNYQNHNNPEMPYWGFSSYNDFFHRQLDLEQYRPLPEDDSDKVVVSANDGTVYRISRDVKRCDEFWNKGQPYSLLDMLGGTSNNPTPTPEELIEPFIGGDVMQSFLSGADYHRWHAPISGKVIRAQVIEGMTFSELRSEGLDLSAGTDSQVYQAMVNTRGLVIIESDQGHGLVAIIPIGITEISSISLSITEGQRVEKGQELGYFSYGGSTLALVFQKDMVASFTAQEASENAEFPACKCTNNCSVDQGCLRVRGEIARLK